ncbi:MAG: Gfo/Idh/MocA family oxidoreductase [Prolixibacteraceae bacterium]|nr:Gfo/Idh/MocA family oxidoreductase [Prolixibacteraceae bacterium]
MKTTSTNTPLITFALIGAAGYAAPKHLAAIKELGGKVIAVSDPNDNLEVLDNYFPDCEYFKSTFELEKFLKEHPVDYGVICSPSFLHTDHIEMMVQSGCDVICESPLVITTKEYERVQKAGIGVSYTRNATQN